MKLHLQLTTFLLLLLFFQLPPISSSSPSSSLYLKLPLFSAASSGSGQYLVSLPLGSPPQPLPLVLDTSSDVLWSLCSLHHHRRHPHPHHHPPPTSFHPHLSSSFHPLPCSHPLCSLVPSPLCSSRHCRYLASYSDLSYSSGLVSLESASFPNSTTLATLVFGCALNASGSSFPPRGPAAGVLALGRGATSLPSQLRRLLPSPTFSYCLPDYTLSPPPTTFLILGRHPRHHRRRLAFTPLLRNPLSPTFYYVPLEGIQIDGTQLAIDPAVFALDPRTGTGGTVVDSGTTLSFLPAPAYRLVLAAMERQLRLPRVTVARGGAGTAPEFDLCVNVSGVGGRELPRMGLRMRGGAVMLPPPRNYFVEAADGVRCLAVQPVVGPGGFGVIGNLMQQGYLVVFDRELDRFGFSRSGCAIGAA